MCTSNSSNIVFKYVQIGVFTKHLQSHCFIFNGILNFKMFNKTELAYLFLTKIYTIFAYLHESKLDLLNSYTIYT